MALTSRVAHPQAQLWISWNLSAHDYTLTFTSSATGTSYVWVLYVFDMSEGPFYCLPASIYDHVNGVSPFSFQL